VGDRKVFVEDGLEALLRIALLGREVGLDEVLERLELDLEEVRIVEDGLDLGERLAGGFPVDLAVPLGAAARVLPVGDAQSRPLVVVSMRAAPRRGSAGQPQVRGARDASVAEAGAGPARRPARPLLGPGASEALRPVRIGVPTRPAAARGVR